MTAMLRIGLGTGSGRTTIRIGGSGPALLTAALRREQRRVVVVTDPHLHEIAWPPTAAALRAAGVEVAPPLLVPAGEAAKTLGTLERLLQRMLHRGLDRDSLLVALGGGTVTDSGGFAAATYMRGIDWIAVPTTLLGMVDAAIGGKVGVNLGATKNAAGAFHPPREVLVGTDFLRTLPARARRSGLAEMVKYAMIADRRLFVALERGAARHLGRQPQADARLVARCCRIKARFVERDVREEGVRAVLNFGHTVGHALEADGAGKLTHGEAVALGMLVATAIAEIQGTAREPQQARLAALLRQLGLPVRATLEPKLARLQRFLRHDKKARAGELRFVLAPRIGAYSIGNVVDAGVLARALATIAPARPRRSRAREQPRGRR